MYCCLLFSCKVVSQSLWSHELQHARLLCLPVSRNMLRSTESVMLSNHLILYCPLLLLPLIFPSIRVFSNELAVCIRWPKYWIFSISPSNEYSVFPMISFRSDWFDLLAVQGTLESLHHPNSEASVIWCSAFFMVQLSKPYMKNYWENHGFDCMNLCQKNNVSAL